MRPASVYPLENYNSMSRVNQIKGKMLITGKIEEFRGDRRIFKLGSGNQFPMYISRNVEIFCNMIRHGNIKWSLESDNRL